MLPFLNHGAAGYAATHQNFTWQAEQGPFEPTKRRQSCDAATSPRQQRPVVGECVAPVGGDGTVDEPTTPRDGWKARRRVSAIAIVAQRLRGRRKSCEVDDRGAFSSYAGGGTTTQDEMVSMAALTDKVVELELLARNARRPRPLRRDSLSGGSVVDWDLHGDSVKVQEADHTSHGSSPTSPGGRSCQGPGSPRRDSLSSPRRESVDQSAEASELRKQVRERLLTPRSTATPSDANSSSSAIASAGGGRRASLHAGDAHLWLSGPTACSDWSRGTGNEADAYPIASTGGGAGENSRGHTCGSHTKEDPTTSRRRTGMPARSLAGVLPGSRSMCGARLDRSNSFSSDGSLDGREDAACVVTTSTRGRIGTRPPAPNSCTAAPPAATSLRAKSKKKQQSLSFRDRASFEDQGPVRDVGTLAFQAMARLNPTSASGKRQAHGVASSQGNDGDGADDADMLLFRQATGWQDATRQHLAKRQSAHSLLGSVTEDCIAATSEQDELHATARLVYGEKEKRKGGSVLRKPLRALSEDEEESCDDPFTYRQPSQYNTLHTGRRTSECKAIGSRNFFF